MNKRNAGTHGLAALFLIAAVALALPPNREAEGSEAPVVRRVRVAEVKNTSSAQTVRFSGVVRSADRAGLAFTVGARLASRPVEAGEQVQKGRVLARLQDRKLRLGLDQTTAALAEVEARRVQAMSERARVERLFESKAATADELEQTVALAEAVEAAHEAARARLADAERLVGESVLTAPFAGTVAEVRFEVGEFVPAGQPVVVLSGPGKLEVEVGVPEREVLAISAEDRVRVALPIAGLRTEGRVRRVGRAAASSGGLFPIVVSLDETERVLPGMTAEVAFTLDSGDTLTVPLAAVLNPGGARPQVFRLVDGRVERVAIEVESLLGERVAVSGALTAGDRVVVAGHTALVNGDRVEVVR
jgi:RND family efflux transporter MFP subunit